MLRISAKDIAGNNNNTETHSFVVDTTPPTLSITEPVAGHRYYTRRISVESTAADATSSITCVYSLDGFVTNTSFTCSETQEIEFEESENTLSIGVKDALGWVTQRTSTFDVNTALVQTHICGDHYCTEIELQRQGITPTTQPRYGSQKDTGFIPLLDITTPTIPYMDININLPFLGDAPLWLIATTLTTILLLFYIRTVQEDSNLKLKFW
ncbi:hypothetical protein DRQ25_00395 [Candidatus Fermentibacteria bacterium]|nr:MAG: hypothetical protein DRQ25_00395 [Candidatus Fermentibacteria bacterium]